MKLRPYQREAVAGIFQEWEERQSTMIVLPTGTGKTQVFCAVVEKALPRRAMIVAHRDELVRQASKRLQAMGIHSEIEMAGLKASTSLFNSSPVVVASVQTLYSGRIERFNPDEFGVLVLDECHHYCAPAYRRVIDHMQRNPSLRTLGVTATADRADEKALGQIFQSVAHDYEIQDAIHDGWLVPIEQQMVSIGGLDYSAIRTTAGDLNGADLAAVVEQENILQGMASATVDIIGGRRTIVFASSVNHAEMLSNIFNRHRDGSSEWVCGKTEKEIRRAILRRFSTGETQIVVNVGVLTEGFDNPSVEVIVMGRPTKSRCLYAQCAGRSTRPLPGVVDGDDLDTPDKRKAAIAASPKPSALILDFVGNSGRHVLCSAADLLGGKYDDEVIARVNAKLAKDGQAGRVNELLDEELDALIAEKEKKRLAEIARRARLVAKASYQTAKVDPFNAYGLTPVKARGWDDGRRLSDKQSAVLIRAGIPFEGLPYTQQKQLLMETFRRWDSGLCTIKQASLLQKHGRTDTANMPMKEASRLIDQLANNRWQRPADWQ